MTGALDRWQEGNNAYLATALSWLRLRLERLSNRTRPSAPPEVAPAFELTGAELALHNAEVVEPPPALLQMRTRFRMSLFEQQVLLLCAAMELDTGLGALCAAAHGDQRRAFPTFGLAFALFDDPAWDSLSPGRPLRYYRLIEATPSGSEPFVNQPLRADERIVSAIKGLNYLDERLAPLMTSLSVPAPRPDHLPPSQAGAADSALQKLVGAAERGQFAVLQLTGSDGASKRSIANYVSSKLGLSLLQLSANLLPSQPTELETLCRLWQRETLLSPVALYLDALDVEQPRPSDPISNQVARFLSRTDGVCFLDSRETWVGLPTQTCPSFVLEVKKPTQFEQRSAWRSLLGDRVSDELVARLSSQFDFSLDEVTAVARGLAGPHVAAEDFERRVWNDCRERARPRLEQLADRLQAKATWDDIVLPESELRSLRQIAAQVRRRGRVYDDWGFRERMNRGFGISALFAGDSGTGKTMAAEVIANEVELDLFRIDLSSVVSKYIGETEKNLRQLFDTAENGGAILFFDEADALFGKRSEVKDSHDRYANIEINYLLQRMEAYSGLAILASNMKSALDQAFMRRLRFIVNFSVPGPQERERIWRSAFPSKVELAKVDYPQLARLNLTGGSIANVAISAAFMAAEAGSPITMPILLEAAKNEFTKLDRPVNEADFRRQPRD